MKTNILEIPSFFNFLKLQKVPAHKLFYTEWGDPLNPSKVLCLHAISRNSRDFDKIAQSLSTSHHVICPDFPGRGKSSWFENKKYYNYHTYFKEILILLRSLKFDNVNIIGTSMGGIIGMILAAFYPKYVKSLIINDIGPHIPGPALMQIKDRYSREIPSFVNFEECKMYLKTLLANFGIQDEEDWDHLTKHSFHLYENQRYYLHFDPKIFLNFYDDSAGVKKDVNFWFIWYLIKCPILLIWGMKSDILLKETVRRMFLKNIDLYQVENAGHAPALVRTQDIQVIVNWLK